MDRRDFFRRGIGKVAEVAVKSADKRVADRAKHWIRPPGAISELEFLLACTRCDACIEACPYSVIFPLSARLGVDVVRTPALDLLKKGCHLCVDWPCINACETNALILDESVPATVQKFANADINEALCLPFSGPECGACVSVCPVEGALYLKDEKPVINQAICIGCALCRDACVVEDKAINITSI